jgi:hypothetical protein
MTKQANTQVPLLCSRLTLVTGLPRSGTTWSGKLIGSHPDVNYIFEPYSKRYHPELKHSETCFYLGANYIAGKNSLNPNLIFNEKVFPQVARYEPILREHLNDLIKHYFPGNETKHLVIKSPKTAKIQWFIKALQPDTVIYLDRHLGAVVNSYIRVKNGLPSWSEPEFRMAKASMGFTNPDLAPLLELPRNRVERATTILALNRQILLSYLEKEEGFRFLRVPYEAFCINVENHLQQIFHFLGLPFDSEISLHCQLAVQKNRAKAVHLEINKNSKAQAWSWIGQLAPPDYNSFKRMHDLLSLQLPLPGRELPAPSFKETIISWLDALPRYVQWNWWELNAWRSQNQFSLNGIKRRFGRNPQLEHV